MDGNTRQTRAYDGGDPLPSASERAQMDCSGRETTYWGILCRTCRELVAFDHCPYPTFGTCAAHLQPGAIRCTQGHNHIYFPRDFQFVSSALSVPAGVMRANRQAYQAVNPSESGPLNRPPGKPLASSSIAPPPQTHPPAPPTSSPVHDSSTIPPTPLFNLPRKTAQAAARQRWTSWAIKKSK